MEFTLKMDLPKSDQLISHNDKILSIGSCFTEHIGNALKNRKFNVLQNPNGVLFDPLSVCKSLSTYILNKHYSPDDLFLLNELWHSWDHHSRFSGIEKSDVLNRINTSQQLAHNFLKQSDWLIITLGSAFHYQLTEYAATVEADFKSPPTANYGVANCHRAPSKWFNKHLIDIKDITISLENIVQQLNEFNPKLNIIFTISPVRHIRDGVIENNRSKARLIEAVHQVVTTKEHVYYFPSYELVIDVLRDYRFYAEDLVHPNYAATDFVLEKFSQVFMNDETAKLNAEIKKLMIARKHRSKHPHTKAHQTFLQAHLEKAKMLQQKFDYLDLAEEIHYFSKEGNPV